MAEALPMPLVEIRCASLVARAGVAPNQLQSAVVKAFEAPFEVTDIDLDVVGDRIRAGPGELHRVAAILLAGELGVELYDAAVDRLQLQDLRCRRLPRRKRHAFEKIENAARVHRVGLGPLHAGSGEILNRPRIHYHHFYVLGMVQGERKLQAVNPGRFQTDPRRAATLGRPVNEFAVSGRGVRKGRQRQPLPRTLYRRD
jgi:hypothetical protein